MFIPRENGSGGISARLSGGRIWTKQTIKDFPNISDSYVKVSNSLFKTEEFPTGLELLKKYESLEAEGVPEETQVFNNKLIVKNYLQEEEDFQEVKKKMVENIKFHEMEDPTYILNEGITNIKEVGSLRLTLGRTSKSSWEF